MSTDLRPLRLGTRASKLARWQADWVAGELRSLGHLVEIVEVRTSGDANQAGPIAQIISPGGGGQGVFTKEIQRALITGKVDLAVHSLKDLPTTPVTGLTVAAVPQRAPVADVLISPHATTVEGLPRGARVGTGSFRRRAQLLSQRPDLVVEDLRGNVETRLAKVDSGEFDATLLAEAGLARLEMENRLAGRIPPELLLPAPGQGALGLECREDDPRTMASLAALDHPVSHQAVAAERAALTRLEGGCLAALGAWARWDELLLQLSVVVLSDDGVKRLDADASASCSSNDEAIALGESVADELLARGAAALLRSRSV